MRKAPNKADTRAKALAAMTKAELIKTIKALDKRQTQLLNELAFEKEKFEASQAVSVALMRKDNEPQSPELDTLDRVGGNHVTPPPPKFPWST